MAASGLWFASAVMAECWWFQSTRFTQNNIHAQCLMQLCSARLHTCLSCGMKEVSNLLASGSTQRKVSMLLASGSTQLSAANSTSHQLTTLLVPRLRAACSD